MRSTPKVPSLEECKLSTLEIRLIAYKTEKGRSQDPRSAFSLQVPDLVQKSRVWKTLNQKILNYKFSLKPKRKGLLKVKTSFGAIKETEK